MLRKTFMQIIILFGLIDCSGNTEHPAYRISGKIVPAIEGVVLTLSGEKTDFSITDTNGRYTLAGLEPGAYTVAPSHIEYIFSPQNRSVTLNTEDVAGVDFAATAIDEDLFSISGTITGDIRAGVSLKLSNGLSVTSNFEGEYSFSNVNNGFYTITPSLDGYTFVPVDRQVTVAEEDVVGVDFVVNQVDKYRLSGTISGEIQEGVSIHIAGIDTQTTNQDGEYQFSNLPPGDYTVYPTLAGYIFQPTSQKTTIEDNDISGIDFIAMSNRGPIVGSCPVFPADNPWNTPVDGLDLHPKSQNIIAKMPNKGLHLDFGAKYEGHLNGIPYHVVSGNQKLVNITYKGEGLSESYPGESDCGPMPIPSSATVENSPDWGMQNGSSDRHVIIVDIDNCVLYELYLAHMNPDGSWYCGGSAIFDLYSNSYRPMGWTSADAAGLPIFPGLVRWYEVENAIVNQGDLGHALRFTMMTTRGAFILPATHFASSNFDEYIPPMGMRFRLRADFDITTFSKKNKVLLRTLKKYGMILADNGGDWFISGVPNQKPCDPAETDCQGPSEGWSSDDFSEIKGNVFGNDFEVVNTGKEYSGDPGIVEAANEIEALVPIDCTPPWQTGLSCACY